MEGKVDPNAVTREARSGEQTKGELYCTKLNATTKVRETKGDQKNPKNQVARKAARQRSNKRKQQDKVQINNQRSTQTWKTQNQNIPDRSSNRNMNSQRQTKTNNDRTKSEEKHPEGALETSRSGVG